MRRDLPDELRDALNEKFGKVKSFTTVPGGCINNGGQLVTASGRWFVKWNDALKFPGMFDAEARGLIALSQTRCIRVPGDVSSQQVGAYQVLTMEWIQQTQATSGFWEKLGRDLAALHQTTAQRFGLDHNNYIGSLQQRNDWSDNWIDFFVRERIEPQLRILRGATRIQTRFETLFKLLPEIFPDEKPALLHGDLWGGNLIKDENGGPCLIDPAVYFGNREMELAFTHLFGGFDGRFYDTYKEVFPLAPGFEERVDVCNLYPLLVHANLFGGHYLLEIEDILGRWA
jgi:protein-ribulosamine 3-kinase